MDPAIPDLRYPRFVKRLQALYIDGFAVVFLLFGLGSILSNLDIGGPLKAGIFVLAVVILEPGLVWLTGGTIGHHLRGLRIQNDTNGDNLNFFAAVLRFALKSLLGVVSLALIFVTKRRQAIHDVVSRSVVVLRNPIDGDGLAGIPEQEVLSAEYDYPFWLRRVLVSLFYVLGGLAIVSFALQFLISDACLFADRCTASESLRMAIAAAAWLFASFAVIFFGLTGRLWMARRKPRVSG